ncbi:MAG: translation initiation factor IF-2 subunit alpha [Euryarchaeota archaeon]|nr:translation initiation factor IF-2 subunit alpha [Euryarchaeota archaeon]
MVLKRQPFPDEGELVVCTVTKVYPHGAFARLDEYRDRDGYIHISEVASTWIKNIRDFVREGQKTVAKVLAVDRKKGHVDLSLRRVSEAAKKKKMQEWKRAQKAEKLLEMAAKELGKSLEQAYKEVGFKLEEEFGEIYGAFEEISAAGEEALEGIDIPQEWIKPLVKLAQENVSISKVKIHGFVELRSRAPDGVEVIRKALLAAKEAGKDAEGVSLDIAYVGSPRYRITVVAYDYKTAEEVLRRAGETAVKMVVAEKGEGRFYRG